MGTPPRRLSTRLFRSVCRVAVLVCVGVSLLGWGVAQPSCRRNGRSSAVVDPGRLHRHVVMLSETLRPRDWTQTGNLDACADYIAGEFTAAGAEVQSQPVKVHGRVFRNVIGRFGSGRGGTIVVGAHYDAFEDLPGADDNASGIAALIELAHWLGRETPALDVELVAYTLEEPPFFRTPAMGSAVHAASVASRPDRIRGVIVLEMVGCFRDEPGSQSYPSMLLRLIYPSRGNFIAVVGRLGQGGWVKAVKRGMKGATDLPVWSLRAPTAIPGIDFSDHASYWPHGIQAVMVTDTAFYRNDRYHTAADTAESLDYGRMSMVVVAVFEALRQLAPSR